MTLSLSETTITDRYDVTGVTVARMDHLKAAQVTSVTVEVTTLIEDGKPVLVVNTRLAGTLLGVSGKPLANALSCSRVFGETEAEDRWDIAREAVLATFARHGFDPALTDSFHVHLTFAQYRAAQQAAILKTMGF